MIFFISSSTKLNIEVSGWQYETKIHINMKVFLLTITIQPYARYFSLTFLIFRPLFGSIFMSQISRHFVCFCTNLQLHLQWFYSGLQHLYSANFDENLTNLNIRIHFGFFWQDTKYICSKFVPNTYTCDLLLTKILVSLG